jgi:hypothetical protein
VRFPQEIRKAATAGEGRNVEVRLAGKEVEEEGQRNLKAMAISGAIHTHCEG